MPLSAKPLASPELVASLGDSSAPRSKNEWRLGLTGGVSMVFESGFVQYPDFPPDTKNFPLPFAGDISGGWLFNGFALWQPEALPFALVLALGLDRRTSVLTAPIAEQDFIVSLRSIHSSTFFSLLPSIRVPIPLFSQPFSLIGGIGVDVLVSSSIQPLVQLVTPGNPQQEYNTTVQPAPLRWNMVLGLGYTWNIPTFFPSGLELFPALTVQVGTKVIQQSDATWNQMALRFSLAASLPFPTAEQQPENRPPAQIPPVIELNTLALNKAQQLWLLLPKLFQPYPIVHIAEPLLPNLTITEKKLIADVLPEQPAPQPQINTPQSFEYQTTQETQLNPMMKLFLDLVAQMMKTQQRLTLRIIGHTDNIGTRRDKQLISEARALAAVRYLHHKGIARTRIFDTGVGDRQPIADNRTEAGRSKNRRLELIILEK